MLLHHCHVTFTKQCITILPWVRWKLRFQTVIVNAYNFLIPIIIFYQMLQNQKGISRTLTYHPPFFVLFMYPRVSGIIMMEQQGPKHRNCKLLDHIRWNVILNLPKSTGANGYLSRMIFQFTFFLLLLSSMKNEDSFQLLFIALFFRMGKFICSCRTRFSDLFP